MSYLKHHLEAAEIFNTILRKNLLAGEYQDGGHDGGDNALKITNQTSPNSQ